MFLAWYKMKLFSLFAHCFCNFSCYCIKPEQNKQEFSPFPHSTEVFFHALSNVLSSIKFQSEIVVLWDVVKVRKYQCYFQSCFQEAKEKMNRPATWMSGATCAHSASEYSKAMHTILTFFALKGTCKSNYSNTIFATPCDKPSIYMRTSWPGLAINQHSLRMHVYSQPLNLGGDFNF